MFQTNRSRCVARGNTALRLRDGKFRQQRFRSQRQHSRRLAFEPLEWRALLAVDFTVNTVGDAGDSVPGNGVCDTGQLMNGVAECTLRAAIQESNAHANVNATTPDTIGFNIAGAGQPTIEPSTALPSITDPVVIDGSTQSVILSGSKVTEQSAVGLRITAGSSVVSRLKINHFNYGITLQAGGGNRVEENSFQHTENPRGVNAIYVDNSSNNYIGGNSIKAFTSAITLQGGGGNRVERNSFPN